MRNAYLNHIEYALGDTPREVEQAVQTGLVRSPSRALREAGFAYHHTCEAGTSAYSLAQRCVAQLGVDLNDVDAIVYSTCLPANANLGSEAAFTSSGDVKHLMDFPASHLQHDFGMQRAQVFGVTQLACTGALAGLRLARMLINDDAGIHKVLCVTADRFPGGAHYEQAYNLISDGAAACLVSAQPAGYRILAAHGITNGALARAGDDETVGTFFSYAHRAIQETLARAGLSLDEIDWIVPQNTHRHAWQILSRLLPFELERIAFPTIAEVGHVISGDNLINLKHLDATAAISPGEKILLFMAGYGLNWHCLILEKEEA